MKKFAWLAAHDIRLAWRGFIAMFDGWSNSAAWAASVTGLVCLHLLAFGMLQLRADYPATFSPTAARLAIAAIFAWMVAQGVLGATRQLYERGHVDVLFASPLSPWMAVASRALAITAGSLGSLAPLILPSANVGAIVDGPHWLLLYPVLTALAFSGTALGFLIAIGLFFAVGAQRARMVAQLTAALVGGSLILGAQIASLLPTDAGQSAAAWWRAATGIFEPLGTLIAAAEREPAAAAAIAIVGSLVVFATAVAALTGAFIRATHLASGSSPATHATRGADYAFRPGVFAALRRKEWRLLVRDPNLFAQLGLQIIYTLPIAVFLLRSPDEIPPAVALVPLVVVLAAQIAASLAWITVSGEDAPELIASAPLTPTAAALAKLSAVAAPLIVILAVPLIVIALISHLALAYAIAFGAAAAMTTSLLNFWHPMPGNRRGLLRRHSQSKIVAIAEHGLALLWAVTVVLALVDLRLALAPLALVAGVLWVFRPKRARSSALQ
jgi:ABC-2 type transport system permease protein